MLALTLRILLRDCKDGLVLVLKGGVVDCFYDGAEKEVGNFRDNDPDHVRAAGRKIPGNEVWAVAELCRDLAYELRSFIRDIGMAAQCLRHGDTRDLQSLGNIIKCNMGFSFHVTTPSLHIEVNRQNSCRTRQLPHFFFPEPPRSSSNAARRNGPYPFISFVRCRSLM